LSKGSLFFIPGVCIVLSVSIQANCRSVAEDLRRLSNDVRQKVIGRALRKTASNAKTETARAIKDEYKISSRVVGKSIKVSTVYGPRPKAEITVKGRPLPMAAFKPKQTKVGVRVRIKGKALVVPHAFVAKMRSGHSGVFARGSYKSVASPTGNFGRFKFSSDRLPINEFFTFSLPQGFNNKVVMSRVIVRFQARYPINLQHEYEWAAASCGFR
jgi:hypothetical protein